MIRLHVHLPRPLFSDRAARLRPFLSLLLLLSVSPAWPQDVRPLNPELVAGKWPASWIAFPGAPPKEPGVYYFRKEITLASPPAHYWVHVSADNRFLLHVNGTYAAEGPARGDLFHWRFETVDLAPLLRAGSNVLAATVWNDSVDSPVAQISDRTGFLIQGDTAAEQAANTDKSWKAEREQSRSLIRPSGVSGYYAAGLESA